MSADNWTVCPKCKGENATSGYTETLREDYELGIEDSYFEVRYRASCVERLGGCGWNYSFEREEKVT